MNLRKIIVAQKKKGVILIELLLALAIGSAILTAISSSLAGNQQTNLQSYQNQQAQFIIQEMIEATRACYSVDWECISTNGTYYPQIVSGNWQLNPGEITEGIFTKKINITDVMRNEQGEIITQGGMLDPSTKKITVDVSWSTPRPTSINQSYYLTRWRKNYSWLEDTFSDFIDGVEKATDVTGNPGYVQLAQTGGDGEWTEPTVVTSVDALNKGNGIWANDGYLYFALGDNEKKVQVFDIETDPKLPVSLGTFNTAAEVNNLAISGNYLYAALDSTNGLQIFDLSVNPVQPTEVATRVTHDKPNGLWPQNGYLFAAIESKTQVEVYSLADPINPVYQGSFNTPYTTMDVSGSGNYLYIAQDSNSHAIAIYDISASVTSPRFVGTVSCFYNSRGIWLEGNTIYLSLSGKRAAMYSLTVNPLSPLLLGIFQTEQNSSDITALGDYGYIAGADSWKRALGVIFVGDSKGVSGIYFVYGEYTSSTLDAGKLAAFNRLSWEGTETGTTNILFQIAVNNDNSTWNFVGPDGTAASYFQEPQSVPLNNMLGRYLKYKIILTGDGDLTPVVDKVIVNYSL